MKPHELIEAQRDLVIRAQENDDFQRYTASLTVNQYKYHVDGPHTPAHTDVNRLGPIMGEHLSGLAQHADLYQVTEDMTPLITHAAAGLDEMDRWSRHNAPSPIGMARFEKPLIIRDTRGRDMLCHWIVWGPMVVADGTSGIGIYIFNDTVTEPDVVQHEIWAEVHARSGQREVEQIRGYQGRWALMGVDFCAEDMRLGPETTQPTEEAQAALVGQGVTPHGATNFNRLIHALWLLLNQTIVNTHEPEIPRSHLKIARRMKMPGKITVITLRRFDGSRYEGESHVEWSHRWVVKGHWRWQACGPRMSERKRIWVAPFIKGPNGKPLIITDKIYRLAR